MDKNVKQAQYDWEAIYKQYARKMYGVCLRYARNKEEAKDILHDGFEKVFNNLHEYQSIGSFEGWIRRIMVYTAINTYRRYQSKWFPLEDTQSEQIIDNEVYIIENISHQELISHIQSMPDGYRMVFNMYVIEGYKHNEIAEILGISESTSKTQLMKARNYLKNKIGIKCYEKAL